MPEYGYFRDRREDLRSFSPISYIIKLAGHRPAGSRKKESIRLEMRQKGKLWQFIHLRMRI